MLRVDGCVGYLSGTAAWEASSMDLSTAYFIVFVLPTVSYPIFSVILYDANLLYRAISE